MLLNSDRAMAERGFPERPDLKRPLTGRSVVIMLGLFFGVMFVANGALVYTALSHAARRGAGEFLRREPGLQPAHRRGARPGRAGLGRRRDDAPGRRRASASSPISAIAPARRSRVSRCARASCIRSTGSADREAILDLRRGRLRRRRRRRCTRAGGPSSSRRKQDGQRSSRAGTRSPSRRPRPGTNR